MSTYYFLTDHYIGQYYYPAGTFGSTVDVGGTLPKDWVPSGGVDPMDQAAVTAFYGAGPQFPQLTRTQFTVQMLVRPKTYWVPLTFPNLNNLFMLVGLGQVFGFTTPFGVAPGTGFAAGAALWDQGTWDGGTFG